MPGFKSNSGKTTGLFFVFSAAVQGVYKIGFDVKKAPLASMPVYTISWSACAISILYKNVESLQLWCNFIIKLT